MSKGTYLDDLITFKENVIVALSQSQDVMGLLANDPNLDLESSEAEDVVERNIFDYDYIDGTLERHDAYIMVDDELVQPSSGTFNRWLLYVQVVCAKTFNDIDKKMFRGVKGNRRDNLARSIDVLLNGSRDYGVGKLVLMSVAPATVPDKFTSLLLTYEIRDFRAERVKGLADR
nr:MAG TPA: hypothetical protein [Caudoviricetes sp.]